MSSNQPNLYGGWRRSYTLGIGTLNTGQTVIVVAAILGVIMGVVVSGLSWLPVSIPAALVLIVLTVWQRQGMPLLSYLVARLRWRWAATKGETSYRSQFLTAPAALDLPGMAAATQLIAAERPGAEGPVGLVWNQRTGTMTPTLLLSPAGALLAAGSTVESSVRSWADTLASLADEEAVQAASVTIQITPSSGQAFTDHVAGRLDRSSPDLARETVRELVARSPRASAQLAAWFSLVIDPAQAVERPRSPSEAAAETLRVLDGVDLAGTGADVIRIASGNDIKRLVRGGFTPADMDAPAEQVAELMWHEVGPVAADDGWELYSHDGSSSISWVLRSAPRKSVPYDVLLRLLSPGQFMRRVTIAYRVLGTDEGAAMVDREINAEEARKDYRRRTKRATTYRERVDAERAEQTAEEEATGSAIVQWSIYVTTTVEDIAELPAARREVEKAARASGGLRMRYAYGGQAAALMVGLPLGINPLL